MPKFKQWKKSNKTSVLRQYDMSKGVYVLPNLLTTAAIFCGFFAIIHSLHANYSMAAWSIFIAGVFDMMDGRVARMANASSEFGVQYDSLSDLASFGLAPAILAYSWGLHGFHRVGIAAAFLFFVCGALRLARFNVQSGKVEKKNFQGLPIPMAAGPLITYVIFYRNAYQDNPSASYVLLALTIVGAMLMVSNVPYQSFKHFTSRRKASFFYLVGTVMVVFFFIICPHEFVFVTALVYASSGPVLYVLSKLLPKKAADLNYDEALLGGSTPPANS